MPGWEARTGVGVTTLPGCSEATLWQRWEPDPESCPSGRASPRLHVVTQQGAKLDRRQSAGQQVCFPWPHFLWGWGAVGVPSRRKPGRPCWLCSWGSMPLPPELGPSRPTCPARQHPGRWPHRWGGQSCPSQAAAGTGGPSWAPLGPPLRAAAPAALSAPSSRHPAGRLGVGPGALQGTLRGAQVRTTHLLRAVPRECGSRATVGSWEPRAPLPQRHVGRLWNVLQELVGAWAEGCEVGAAEGEIGGSQAGGPTSGWQSPLSRSPGDLLPSSDKKLKYIKK